MFGDVKLIKKKIIKRITCKYILFKSFGVMSHGPSFWIWSQVSTMHFGFGLSLFQVDISGLRFLYILSFDSFNLALFLPYMHCCLGNLVFQAAYDLGIKSLLDLACQTTAEIIKGKTPDQIRRTFNITSDLTPKEEQEEELEGDRKMLPSLND